MSRIKQTSGSIMLAALIMTLITGTLVGVYLKTIVQEEELSYRSRMAFQAVNLAEAGIDYAIYSFIRDDWSSWTAGGDGYYRANFSELTSPAYFNHTLLGTNEEYVVKVYAQTGNPGSDTPSELPAVLAEGTVQLKNGISIRRQILVRLQFGASDDPSKGGFWGNGLLAKRSLTFGGNKQTVDSFSSSYNPFYYTDINDIYQEQVTTTILGHELANGNGTVASTSVNSSDITIGNADIYGSLATGADIEGVNIDKVVGPGGSIYNEATQSGDETFVDNVDSEYISYDFYASLPDATNPDMENPYTSYSDGTIGIYNAETEYELEDSISLTGDETITIKGDVVLTINGDLSTSGNGAIILEEGATLELYVTGDIALAGNGLVNTGIPANLLIFNTGKDTKVTISGNGALSGAIYAPNSDVVMNGSGTTGVLYGAVVGDTVTLNGHYAFHYDEDLADLGEGDEDPNDESFVPEVYSWTELTDASEIRNMATILSEGI